MKALITVVLLAAMGCGGISQSPTLCDGPGGAGGASATATGAGGGTSTPPPPAFDPNPLDPIDQITALDCPSTTPCSNYGQCCWITNDGCMSTCIACAEQNGDIGLHCALPVPAFNH